MFYFFNKALYNFFSFDIECKVTTNNRIIKYIYELFLFFIALFLLLAVMGCGRSS